MIKELVQFTESISDLKDVGLQPKYGLYIQLRIDNDDGHLTLKVIHSEVFGKKTESNAFLKHCASVVQNTWMVDTNKCFDLPTKGIHSCSPYCVAFKREGLPTLPIEIIERKVEKLRNEMPEKTTPEAADKKAKEYEAILKSTGEKFKANQKDKKAQVYERVNAYFEKAFLLLNSENVTTKPDLFTDVNAQNTEGGEKGRIEVFRNNLNSLEGINTILREIPEFEDLTDAEYIVFFLDESIEKMAKASGQYLRDKLFNTDKYNTPPNAENEVFGTSNFLNGFGLKKPFLMHQTAVFDISGRISTKDARSLFDFGAIIGRRVLPNPLPIFIYPDEQKLSLPILRSNAQEEPEKRMGYQEIIKKVIESKKQNKADDAVGNYYLLFFSLGEVKDFDFVSRFDYELRNTEGEKWKIEPLFSDHFQMELSTVFDFQNRVLPTMLNNALVVNTKAGGQQYKYFDDIDSNYCKTADTYLLVMKYRKAFYDFIYKSQSQSLTQTAFEEIMLTLILDDIRLDEYKSKLHSQNFAIKEKLNILFSLHSNFQPFHKKDLFMANQTIQLREFVTTLAKGEGKIETDAQFAFTAGQIIAYLFTKTRSTDRSYSRLEPFLQQTDIGQLQLSIVTFFNRYKHEKYSRRFKLPFSEVTGYQTSANLRQYMPLLLSGFFSNNVLFADKKDEPDVAAEEETV